ncbi:hypothetical protein BDEG_23688 [Batrachochytrium dendrobatidis JEL423]|uniref:Uncharacterized protein n=1 Tax=Batrachochytrium dendrobatidis (strain JEL423) TaxID=403673 RepID=A0A177WKB7_BATDL|nr:hypothetical protein BDEG_23688 [Batrachochytrium dendrobatidis JEL423]
MAKKTNRRAKAATNASATQPIAKPTTSLIKEATNLPEKTLTKRFKNAEHADSSHHEACDDPKCVGCDASQTEVEQAALEELAKSQLEEQDTDQSAHDSIVIRMFEQALEQFELEEKLKEPTDINDSSAPTDKQPSKLQPSPLKRKVADLEFELTKKQVELKERHSECLLDFGLFVKFEGHLRDALKLLSECKQANKSTDLSLSGWCLEGRIAAALVQILYYPEVKVFDSDSDSDHEADTSLSKTSVTKDEQQLTACSLDAFEKAISQRRTGKDHTAGLAILKTTLGYIQQYFQSFAETPKTYDAVYVDMQRTHAICLYHLACILQHSEVKSKLKKACDYAKQSVVLWRAVLEVSENSLLSSQHQQLGESAILWSSLEDEDDDAALTAFDEASVALQRAYELDPDNDGLHQQLVDLGLVNEDSDDEA